MADKTLLVKVRSIFSAAANRVNLVSGEDLEVSLGKISKWLTDLGTAAFTNSTDYAAASHNQATNTITAMTGYAKPQSTSAITASDTLNQAIGKLEKRLDGAGTPNDGVLTIQQNGTPIGTFSANQAGNTTVNIEAAPAPYIISNAVNSDDGTSVVLNGIDVGITDTVNYSNLFAGETYTLKTKVYNTVTQTYLSITKNGTSSTEITSTITPSTNSGSYINTFNIDDLTDTTDDTILNVVEKLYYNNEVISTHTSNVMVDAALTSWELLQAKVRVNNMNNINIGDQFECNYGDSTLTWIVIDKNHDTPTDTNKTNSLTLRLYNALPENMYYDAQEAIYYCKDALPLGTYCLRITLNGSYAIFTTKNAIPQGGQIVPVYSGNSIKQFNIYASAYDTTPIEICSFTWSSSQSGTYLGGTSYSSRSETCNVDYMYRTGNGVYKESIIRQWLNSDKPAGEWWSPQNNFDRIPSIANTWDGFLYKLDPDFKNVVGQTQVTSKYSLGSSASYQEVLNDKFFLLSTDEIYCTDNSSSSSHTEGYNYSYYINNSSLSSPSYYSDTNRIIYRNGVAVSYLLRSHGGESWLSDVGKVDIRGNAGKASTYGGKAMSLYAIVPVCNII